MTQSPVTQTGVTQTRVSRGRLAAALVPALLLTAGCSGLSGTGDLQYVPGQGNVAEVAAADREAPVELSGESLQGKPVDLADLRGEVTVVNVWWSGCTPCRTEMPLLVEASQQLDDVAFVGINTRNPDRGTAIAFEREFDVPFPSIYDDTGAPLLAFGTRYAPQAMPSTVVLDEDGRVGALISGPIPSALTLREVVEQVQDGGSVDG